MSNVNKKVFKGGYLSEKDSQINAELLLNGNLIYNNNPADGYILISDSNGLATWTSSDNIGGGTQSLSETLEFGNQTGANNIIINDAQDLRSEDESVKIILAEPTRMGNITSFYNNNSGIEFQDGFVTLSNDRTNYELPYIYLENSNYGQLAVSENNVYYGFNIYKDNTYNNFSTGISIKMNVNNSFSTVDNDNPAIIIGSKESTINQGVFNSVIIGGDNITATESNTVYVSNLNIQSVTSSVSDELLVIESDGKINYRDVSTISSGEEFSGTQGSVLFIDSTGSITENNDQFFWDNINFRLGIRTNDPQESLDTWGNIRVSETLTDYIQIETNTNGDIILNQTGDKILIGQNATGGSTDEIISIGRNTNSVGNESISIGSIASTDGNRGIAIGRQSKAASNNVAIGYQTGFNVTQGTLSVLIGSQTGTIGVGTRSVAIGVTSNALNSWGIAIGSNALSENDASIAIGRLSSATASNSISIGNESTSRGSSSIAIGRDSLVNVTQGVGIGHNSTIDAARGIGIGFNSTVNNVNGIGIGYDSTVSGDSALSLGWESTSNATFAVALGPRSIANNQRDIAIGGDSSAFGGSSIAIGRESSTNGGNSIAIGYAASGTFSNTIAIGRNSNPTVSNSYLISSDSTGTVTNNVQHSFGIAWNDSPSVPEVLFSRSSDQYISGSGNLGIGLTGPTETLDVNGNIRVRGLTGSDIRNLGIDQDGVLLINNVLEEVQGGFNINISGTESNIINLDESLIDIQNITYDNNINTGVKSIVLGDNNFNDGVYNIITGLGNTHSGNITGANIISGQNNYNISGSANIITGNNNTNDGSTNGDLNIIFGSDNNNINSNNTILGGLNNENNTANRSIISGLENTNNEISSIVSGNSNINNGENSLVIGSNNTNNLNNSLMVNNIFMTTQTQDNTLDSILVVDQNDGQIKWRDISTIGGTDSGTQSLSETLEFGNTTSGTNIIVSNTDNLQIESLNDNQILFSDNDIVSGDNSFIWNNTEKSLGINGYNAGAAARIDSNGQASILRLHKNDGGFHTWFQDSGQSLFWGSIHVGSNLPSNNDISFNSNTSRNVIGFRSNFGTANPTDQDLTHFKADTTSSVESSFDVIGVDLDVVNIGSGNNIAINIDNGDFIQNNGDFIHNNLTEDTSLEDVLTIDNSNIVHKTPKKDIQLQNYISTGASFTITDDINTIVIVTTFFGDVTITLPDSSTIPNGTLYTVKYASGGNTLTVATNGTQEIDGDSADRNLTLYQSITVVSFSNNWLKVGEIT